ncbi:MAG TPA: hypothetical protein P5572_09370 [Phycisphaerae bacterium]|nr:hypothetical protein [Phycisphaerales bacterium]HRX85212.1 hypothetical protein [Phycisphaerae bacterium]
MFGRWFRVVMTVWALQASQALCTAGVLAHPCDVRTELAHDDHAPCTDAVSAPDDAPGSCSHEQDCPADPCHQLVMVKEAAHPVLVPMACPSAVSEAPVAADLAAAHYLPGYERGGPTRPPLPLHPSDLPLLI